MAARGFDWPLYPIRSDPKRLLEGKRAIDDAMEIALAIFKERPWQNYVHPRVLFPNNLSDGDKEELIKYSGYYLAHETLGDYRRMNSYLEWPWAGDVFLEVPRPRGAIYRQRQAS